MYNSLCCLYTYFLLQLYNWGCGSTVPISQSITFYQCTALMAARLKSLFEIFAADLLEDLAKELDDTPLEYKLTGI